MIAKIKNIDSNDIKLRFGRIITQISAQKFHPSFSTAPLLPSIISIILLITPFVLPIFSFLSFPSRFHRTSKKQNPKSTFSRP